MLSLKVSKLWAVLAMHISSMGGSRETEEKEFAVNPLGAPFFCLVVTMVTPVAKVPNADRRSLLSFSESGLGLCLNKSSIFVFPSSGGKENFGWGNLLKFRGFPATRQGCILGLELLYSALIYYNTNKSYNF